MAVSFRLVARHCLHHIIIFISIRKEKNQKWVRTTNLQSKLWTLSEFTWCNLVLYCVTIHFGKDSPRRSAHISIADLAEEFWLVFFSLSSNVISDSVLLKRIFQIIYPGAGRRWSEKEDRNKIVIKNNWFGLVSLSRSLSLFFYFSSIDIASSSPSHNHNFIERG